MCTNRKEGGAAYTYCRTKAPLLGPLFPKNTDVYRKVLSWLLIAHQMPLGHIAEEAMYGVNGPKTVYKTTAELEHCFRLHSNKSEPKFQRVRIDETYVGKRKYNKGKDGNRSFG
eukprot:PhF_6_TR42668/c0_g1_i1/m.64317